MHVLLPLGEPRQALLVNERAIGTDQGQKFLYVVREIDGKNVVEYRPVAAGSLQKGGLRVVMPVKIFRDKDGLRLAKPDEMAKAEDSITKDDWVIVNGIAAGAARIGREDQRDSDAESIAATGIQGSQTGQRRLIRTASPLPRA